MYLDYDVIKYIIYSINLKKNILLYLESDGVVKELNMVKKIFASYFRFCLDSLYHHYIWINHLLIINHVYAIHFFFLQLTLL